MVNSQSCRSMSGVGPADRTGKSSTRYWPGGSSALGRSRPLKPRDTVLIVVLLPLVCPCSLAGSGASRSVGSGRQHRFHARRPPALRLAQRPERRSDFVGEQLGLFPGGEVAALVDLGEIDEVGVAVLDPAARGP